VPDTPPRSEPQPRVIAIGGSADGFGGLTTILQAFPAGFPAAIVSRSIGVVDRRACWPTCSLAAASGR
jgi:hypothetical protein